MQAVATTTTDKPHQRRRGKPLEPPKKPFTRAAARIHAHTHKRDAQRIHARNARTSASTAQHVTRNATRTDGAQHVTKPPQRGQIRAIWSKSINDATARLSSKIEALQAAKRASGATRARATRKGARQGVKGAQDVDGGDGSTLTRRQTAANGAKSDGGGDVDKLHGGRLKAFYGAFTAARRAYHRNARCTHTLTGARVKRTAAPKGDGCAAQRRNARQKPIAKKMSINTTCCPPSSSMSTTGARGTTPRIRKGARHSAGRGTCYLNTTRRYQIPNLRPNAIYARPRR